MGTITNKIQLDHFDCDQHTAQQDHSNTTQDDNQEHYASMDNSDHESDNDLDNSQRIDGMNSDTKFPHTIEILRPVESNMFKSSL